ncbi:hypothetical protein HK096_009206, partial [Nowakowskiella sp. JEL0078]
MKCADVSNPSKCWQIYEQWTRQIQEEFLRQGDMEKNLGIPVSPFMDRDNINMPNCQCGFIDFVVSPLFEAYSKFVESPDILFDLQRNREHWGLLRNTTVALPLTSVIPGPSPTTTITAIISPIPPNVPSEFGSLTQNKAESTANILKFFDKSTTSRRASQEPGLKKSNSTAFNSISHSHSSQIYGREGSMLNNGVTEIKEDGKDGDVTVVAESVGRKSLTLGRNRK